MQPDHAGNNLRIIRPTPEKPFGKIHRIGKFPLVMFPEIPGIPEFLQHQLYQRQAVFRPFRMGVGKLEEQHGCIRFNAGNASLPEKAGISGQKLCVLKTVFRMVRIILQQCFQHSERPGTLNTLQRTGQSQQRADRFKPILRPLRHRKAVGHLPEKFRCLFIFTLFFQSRRQLVDGKSVFPEFHHVAERFFRKSITPGAQCAFPDDGIGLANL